MRSLARILLATTLLTPSAHAADNAVILTVGSGTTMRSIDVGSGVQAMGHILVSAAGTAIYGTAGTANANVLTVQGVTSMTPILATLSGTNTVTTVTTVSTLTGGGVASGATDSGNPVKVGGKYNSTPITLTDGQRGDLQLSSAGYLNVNIPGANANGQATMANSAPVVIASNQTANPLWGQVATGAAPPANIQYVGGLGSGATGGLARALITCDLHAKYTGTDNGSKTLVTGVSGRKVYICGFLMAVASSATALKLREGSDADCASNGADLTGVYSLAANGSIGMMSPFWTGLVVSTNAYYVCINAGAGNQHDADIWYAIL